MFPDGTSALISRGFLNLTHREGHAEPQLLEPGDTYNLGFELSATSWILEPGHRLRLTLAGSDWPNVWPPPEPVTLTFRPESSRLLLPSLSSGNALPAPALPPAPAERHNSDPATKSAESETRVEWRVDHDILGRATHYVVDHGSSYDAEAGSRVTESYYGKITVSTTDPGKASAEGRVRFEIAWPEATAAAEVHATLRSSADEFALEMDLDVFHDGALAWRRRWDRTFPRAFQ